jgi:DNA-binding transcriptional MerR regulator
MNQPQDLFPIGVLAQATGISPMTLRSWERRYGLLTPTRTPKGHRLYNGEDVEKVKRILSYIKRGVSVGKIRPLLQLADDEKDMLDEDAYSSWPDYIVCMLNAVKEFNLNKLDSLYNEIISIYPIEVVSNRLFQPLLKTYQAHICAKYKGAVAEENFLVTYVRNRLGAHFQQLASMSTGSKLLFAALPSERHDFLPLLFAIHCMNAGYKVISLGTNTPMEQVLFAGDIITPHAIVCFGELSKADTNTVVETKHTLFNFAHQKTMENMTGLSPDFSEALASIRQQN